MLIKSGLQNRPLPSPSLQSEVQGQARRGSPRSSGVGILQVLFAQGLGVCRHWAPIRACSLGRGWGRGWGMVREQSSTSLSCWALLPGTGRIMGLPESSSTSLKIFEVRKDLGTPAEPLRGSLALPLFPVSASAFCLFL